MSTGQNKEYRYPWGYGVEPGSHLLARKVHDLDFPLDTYWLR